MDNPSPTDRYRALMDVIRNRMTNRAFASCEIPREHYLRFNMANFMTGAQVDEWIREERAKVMYRDESKVD